MKRIPRQSAVVCHDAKRIMSVLYAYYCAARFINALRFSFFVFFYPPKTICGNCSV